MAASAQSLSAQLQRIDLDDHDQLLKAANEALKRSKGDPEALRLKLFALLKSDRYDDALRLLDGDANSLTSSVPLEHAYALYKLGRFDEARQIAGNGASTGLLHLRAQLAYRLEDFVGARKLYDELRARGEDTDLDLRINAGATDAQLGFAGQVHLAGKTAVDRADRDQFETSFNAACGCLARGEMGNAEALLRSARDLCNATDELSEAEKASEVLPINVQLMYVLCCQGKMEEAARLGEQIEVSSIPDFATRQIALINSLHARGEAANPYLSHRLFHSVPSIPSNQRPFQFQQRQLNWNGKVLDLQSGKTGSIKQKPQFHDGDLVEQAQRSVLSAAAQARNKTGKTAIRQLLPVLERRPGDVGLILTIVHLYVMTNNVSTATSLLESFLKKLETSATAKDQDIRFAPGLVATLVSLYAAQHRTEHTKAELAKAASFWRHKSKGSPAARLLLRHAGAVLADSQSAEDVSTARDIFQQLSTQDSGAYHIAGLAATLEESALASLSADDLAQLPDAARLTAGIDAEKLEAGGIPYATVPTPAATKKRAADAPEKPRKAKKIRASKMPKEYDPDKKVDPERWLPMRDRSYYRAKKKKGKSAGMATQGGVVEEGRPGTPSKTTVVQQGKQGKKKKGKR